MIDYIEIFFRWAFAGQMIFWGLNGLFNWIQIPPSNPIIDSFVKSCAEVKFILPSVKILEIVFGAFLLIGFMVPLSLVVFAPIVFVISGLHLFHNKNFWPILLQFTTPYLIVFFFHSQSLLRLIH